MATPKKGARRAGRRIVFVDESGFYLLPGRVRTWAKRGETPLLEVPHTKDHLSAIGALTEDGRLLMTTRLDASFDGAGVVGFLRHLLRHLEGRLLVVWDGATIHQGRAVRAFLQARAVAKRLKLVRLPAYAPELNPVEAVWRYLKRVELANVVCQSLAHLHREFTLAVKRLRRHARIVAACWRKPGYL